MRQLFTVSLGALVSVLLATGCGDDKQNVDPDVTITSFDVSEQILTSDRNYRATLDGDTVYLDQYVSLHWPVKFGEADLTVLRDSLLSYCFSDTTEKNPSRAIARFVKDTSALNGDDDGADSLRYDIVAIDSLPDEVVEMGCYFNNVMAGILELNEEMVTYQVTASSYFGGAHPFTSSIPFTYDFETSQVLTVDSMFVQGAKDKLMPIIVNALARQLNVPVRSLDRAGIFTSQLTEPGQPYIRNNVLYFHYNPYDIAPYALGMIDVAVYPYEVRDILKPDVLRLFDIGL